MNIYGIKEYFARYLDVAYFMYVRVIMQSKTGNIIEYLVTDGAEMNIKYMKTRLL